MNRRDAIQFLLATPALTTTRALFAQPAIGARSAVVIGVDKPGDLPPLRAARSGAQSFATWLQAEGFTTVKLFVDDSGPVKAAAVFDSIDELVRANPAQLIVYFAGHGFVNHFSEMWLLSGSPSNPNEAVSLVESVELARATRIRNVVFVSDCCRSSADSLRAQRVRGQVIFPAYNPPAPLVCDVDQFLATSVGQPSYEAADASANEYVGIFTSTFIDAFIHPQPFLVSQISGETVVSNAKLRDYLAQEVPKRAEAASIRITQNPDTRLSSPEGTFIARVRKPVAAVPPVVGSPHALILRAPSPTRPGSVLGGSAPLARASVESTGIPTVIDPPLRSSVAIHNERTLVIPGVIERGLSAEPPISSMTRKASVIDVANARLGEFGFKSETRRNSFTDEQLQAVASESGFEGYRSKIVSAQQLPKQFKGRCGFTVSGQTISSVTIRPGVKVRIQNSPDRSAATTQVDIDMSELSDRRAVSAAIRFADGTGTVLPAIDGHVTSIVVHDDTVSSVSFLRAGAGGGSDDRLSDYHALVATSARFGTFRIDGPRELRESNARTLADKIRVLKSVDPTLGIYAAYAYSEAGLLDQVKSVRGYMLDDLRGVDLFDVALLAGALSGQPANSPRRPIPHMPMLSQGWALLRVKRVALHPAVAAAQDYVRQGLWTTLGSEGMDLIEQALQTGELG